MEKRYETAADVRLRLDHSVIRFKDKYYYAQIMRPRGEVADMDTSISLIDLITRKPVDLIDANSDKLDITSVPLGYCESRDWKNCIFLARGPYRRQKQGVSADSLVGYSPLTKQNMGITNDTLMSEGFSDMLNGKYLHYRDILSSIEKAGKKYPVITRPFHRNFCIVYSQKDEKIVIQYNMTDIGEAETDHGLVQLYPEHNHSVFSMKLADLGVTVA